MNKNAFFQVKFLIEKYEHAVLFATHKYVRAIAVFLSVAAAIACMLGIVLGISCDSQPMMAVGIIGGFCPFIISQCYGTAFAQNILNAFAHMIWGTRIASQISQARESSLTDLYKLRATLVPMRYDHPDWVDHSKKAEGILLINGYQI